METLKRSFVFFKVIALKIMKDLLHQIFASRCTQIFQYNEFAKDRDDFQTVSSDLFIKY